jgi:hypothetical protein
MPTTMADRKKKRPPDPPPPKEAESAPEKGADRHLPRSMVALPPRMHRQLKKLAERNNRPVSWELRHVVQKHLEENGLWPPAGDEDESAAGPP